MSDNEFFGGRRRRRGNGGDAFSPYTLFASGEQGVWYDPSDLTPEKVSWRRNLLTYSQDFENAAWTKSNASILSNLALYSQDFDNASWTKTEVTATANALAAPDGTTTADRFLPSTNNVSHYWQITLSSAGGCTGSVYVKLDGSGVDKVTLYPGGAATFAHFNLSNLTTTREANCSASSIVDAGNGWYRCIATWPSSITADRLRVYAGSGATGDAPYAGSGTTGPYFWGAQLVPGSTAQTYTRSLATAAPIQFADPLGGTLADKLVTNASATAGQIFSSPAYAGGVVASTSVYAKAAEWSWLMIAVRGTDGVEKNASFNLSNGTLGTIGSGVTATITAVGSGWYRCESAMLLGAGVSTTRTRIYSANGDAVAGTGDGASGILIFGAQAEQASTASAYQRITDFSSDFLAAFPTHALYQDATSVGSATGYIGATVPVTALGQSVGLVLDKRLGPPGDNLFGYSTWQTIGGWEVATNATLSTSNGQLVVHATGINAAAGYRLTTVVGRQYQFRVRLAQDAMTGNSFMGVGSGGGAGFTANITNLNLGSTPGTYSIIFTATSTDTRLSLSGSSAAVAGEVLAWAEPMVRELPGNFAVQATSASRPTLQARSNLLTYSEQFDNAAWGKGNVTVTANATSAPDGTTTADRATISASSVYVSLFQQATVSPNTQYTFSYWLNTSTSFAGNTIRIYNVTGAADIVAGQACVYSGGWVRQTCTFTTPAGCTSINVYSVSMSVGAGTAGNFFDVWGAQLEQASTASTYQRVVTATDYADVGLPRNLTFDGVDDSLATAGNVDFATWTVGSRRNLLTVPTMFDAAGWVKGNCTITANNAVAPDGTTTADTALVGASTAITGLFQGATLATTTHTISAYVKQAIAVRYVQLLWTSASLSSNFANFDLQTGTVTAGTYVGASITSVGDGWYRITMTSSLSSSPGDGPWLIAVSSGSAGRAGTYVGNSTDTFLLWGAQLELGSTATAFQDVGTDKVTLFSGVFKGTDTGTQEIVEFGNRGITQAGSFSFDVPASAAYRATLEGTLQTSFSPATFAAPITNVVSLLFDIGAAARATEVIPRINGVVNQTSPTGSADAGTGNFGSYVLFVGRRNNATLPFNGRLFQLVIRGAATDSVTVQNAERWVGQLTGVAL